VKGLVEIFGHLTRVWATAASNEGGVIAFQAHQCEAFRKEVLVFIKTKSRPKILGSSDPN
jgi:hypothetical protein